MSLSERLRAAEQQRRAAAGLDQDDTDPDGADPVIDLTSDHGGAVIDLTARRAASLGPRFTAGGISYNPVRMGDASSAFGEIDPVIADRHTTTLCPKCGGPTQIDLFDQVHQTTSLSCLNCFHMFRVEHEI